MANKVYILSIEYNEETEEVEYVQEDVLDKGELETATIMQEQLEEVSYWDEESIKIIRKYYTGEIGES
tara:strand:+ start:355 stop:558 length:204 start_codon:yes stop_codon:yes gene_type:complete